MMVCDRFCSCAVEAATSMDLLQCEAINCSRDPSFCYGCYGVDPLCVIEDLLPCQRVCGCFKACAGDADCEAECLTRPDICLGRPAQCEACRATEALCQQAGPG